MPPFASWGLDISQPTLDECTQQLDRGLSNFETAPVDAAPRKVLDGVGRDAVNFFFSVAVFQHFPSKAYTKDPPLRPMCEGGYGLVQVRYFDGSEKLRQKEGDYAKNVIYMTSFTTAELSALLAETGLALLGLMRDLDNPEGEPRIFFFRK